MGDVVLKISNGCHDTAFISNKTKQTIEQIKEKIIYYYNRDYSFIVPEFFHSYSKKRIVLEKQFIFILCYIYFWLYDSPIEDLFEFKFLIFNNEIKIIPLFYYKHNILLTSYYDADYNYIKAFGSKKYSINNFKNKDLTELKKLALKLSKDFPNFIRVNLYIFHN